jgi:hypothetical protein
VGIKNIYGLGHVSVTVWEEIGQTYIHTHRQASLIGIDHACPALVKQQERKKDTFVHRDLGKTTFPILDSVTHSEKKLSVGHAKKGRLALWEFSCMPSPRKTARKEKRHFRPQGFGENNFSNPRQRYSQRKKLSVGHAKKGRLALWEFSCMPIPCNKR